MSINETIIKAVTPIVPVCVPDVYRPDAGEDPGRGLLRVQLHRVSGCVRRR